MSAGARPQRFAAENLQAGGYGSFRLDTLPLRPDLKTFDVGHLATARSSAQTRDMTLTWGHGESFDGWESENEELRCVES